jgi:glycosyltransferase involved in cell wall biosynthesis
MHILFLTDNFPPEVNAPASRTFEHCREWVKAGRQVTVVTTAPNFPTGKVFPGYRNRLWQSETIEGVRVIRVWSYITANAGFLKRTLDYVSFMLAGTMAALFVRRIDVVVATSPQFFTALAGFLVGFLKRRPWVFELRDLWPESIKAVGAMKDGAALRFLVRLETFLYRRADAIVCVTQAFRRHLIERGIAANKISVVTNGVSLGQFMPRARPEELAKAYGLSNCFVAGYIGTHGMAHGLDTLLDAAALLASVPEASNIRIAFLGDGAEKDRLKGRAEGMTNVVFLESVAKSEVADHWALLNASIIHLKKDELFKTVIPSKIFEAMAMGIPLLHAVEGESAVIVHEDEVGLLIEPENPVALAEAILKLATDSLVCRKFAERGLTAARKYDRRNLANALLMDLEDVAARRSLSRVEFPVGAKEVA